MILVTEFMDEDWVDWLRERSDVTYDPELAKRPDELEGLAQDATALIVRNLTQVRGSLLDAGFTCVGRLGVGLDNIDMDACEARDIMVFPATGANTRSVAEYVITTAAMLLRGAYDMRGGMEAGAWPRAMAGKGREIGGKTLGLIGYGEIARATAGLAKAMGMAVIAHDPHLSKADPAWGDTKNVSLSELFKQSDAVSLHVPHTKETHYLIDADAIAAMKPGSVLINAARGGIVDEYALAYGLRSGHIAAAALDTFEHEPLVRTDRFIGVPNLVLTPHIAGVTTEANTRVSEMTARSVARYLGLRE